MASRSDEGTDVVRSPDLVCRSTSAAPEGLLAVMNQWAQVVGRRFVSKTGA